MKKIHILLVIILISSMLPIQGMTRLLNRPSVGRFGRIPTAVPQSLRITSASKPNVFVRPVVAQENTSTWSWLKSLFSWPQSTVPQQKIVVSGGSAGVAKKIGLQKMMYSTSAIDRKKRVDSIFKKMNEYCDSYANGKLPSQKYSISPLIHDRYYNMFRSDMDDFTREVYQTGYNPLNIYFNGQKSFASKLLNWFFRFCVDSSCRIYGKGDELILRLVSIGLLYYEKECLDVIQQCGMDVLLKQRFDKMDTFNAQSSFEYIRDFSSELLRWRTLLKRIGVDINRFSQKKINWEKIEQLCAYKLSGWEGYPIYSFRKDAIFNIVKGAGFSNIDSDSKEKARESEKKAEYKDSHQQQTGKSEQEKTGQRTHTKTESEKTKTEDKVVKNSPVRNKLIELLSMPYYSSDAEIKKAFYKFVKTAHSDVTKDVTGPRYIKLQTEVNPAWNAYNAELAKEKSKQQQARE